jgi:predicted nucleic acid-binding protein
VYYSGRKEIACLLDTDIVIDFLRRRDYAQKLLNQWAGKGLLAVSTLTHCEICQGMRAGEEEVTNTFLDSMISIAVVTTIARKAGNLIRKNRSKGITTGMADAIIAATALHLGTPLITNNVVHYPFPELNVIRGSSI